MMNALHLLWIIPTAIWLGFFMASALAVGKRGDKER